MPKSTVLNCDCLQFMKTLPDKYYDLCIADMPYGDAVDGDSSWRVDHLHSSLRQKEKERVAEQDSHEKNKIIEWDTKPSQEYIDEIFRISKDQIIWGGNYFSLPPTRCFLVWRKRSISENFSMAMAEYAWTSFNSNAKVFEAAPQGTKDDPRWHPTAKPIALYEWIFQQFCEPWEKIIDPFLGSGSSRIAAYNLNLDFTGCEINPVYYKKQEERFETFTAQMRMF